MLKMSSPPSLSYQIYIQYFFLQGTGRENIFDEKNPSVISAKLTIPILKRDELVEIFRQDSLMEEEIDELKYLDNDLGWVAILRKTEWRIKIKDGDRIKILIKMKDSNSLNGARSNDLQMIAATNQEMQKSLLGLASQLNIINESNLEIKQSLSNLSTALSTLQKRVDDVEEKTSFMQFNNELRREGSLDHVISSAEDPNQIDIAFLYSVPLVSDEKKGPPSELNNPIDYEREISSLRAALEKSETKIKAMFDVATTDTLSDILMKKIKILHITCHGAYETYDDNTFYLLFEEEKTGRLKKFGVEDMKKILGDFPNHKPQLVFLSACYSEAIINSFMSLGLPAMICVKSSTKVLDQAAQIFSTTFYSSLMKGNPIEESFKHAQIVTSMKGLEAPCCCLHRHKRSCQWEKMYKNKANAHNIHVSNCTCRKKFKDRESHVHSRNCIWAKTFYETHLKMNLPSTDEADSSSLPSNLFKVCCCSPEIAHDEHNKFTLKKGADYKNIALFSTQPGIFEIKGKAFFKHLQFNVDMNSRIIGRLKDVFDILSIFNIRPLEKTNRLVSIYGDAGIGKHSFVRVVARYAFERHLFEEMYYLNCKEDFSEFWFIDKISSELGYESTRIALDFSQLSELCNVIKNLNVLIIVNLACDKEENRGRLKTVIHNVIENTSTPTFFVSIEQPLGLAYENAINLKPLNDRILASIFISIWNTMGNSEKKANLDALMSKVDYRSDVLSEDEIIKSCRGCPSTVHNVVSLLKEHSYEMVINILKNQNSKAEDLSCLLMQKIILNNEPKTYTTGRNSTTCNLFQEIIYLLLSLPSGLLDIDIYDIYPKELMLEAKKICTNLSSEYCLVKATSLNDIRQDNYSIVPELITSQSNLKVLDESLKKKMYRQLLFYYAKLFRNMVYNLYKDNEILYEFSENILILQACAMCLNNDQFDKEKPKPVLNISKRFEFCEPNLFSILTNDYLKQLCEVEEDTLSISCFESLVICLPTLIILLKKNIIEGVPYFSKLNNICDGLNHNSINAKKCLVHAIISGILQYKKNSGRFNLVQDNEDMYLKSISKHLKSAEEIYRKMVKEEGIKEVEVIRVLCKIEFEIKPEVYQMMPFPGKLTSKSQSNLAQAGQSHGSETAELCTSVITDLQSVAAYYERELKIETSTRICFFICEFLLWNNLYFYFNFAKDILHALLNKCLEYYSNSTNYNQIIVAKCHIYLGQFYLNEKKMVECQLHCEQAKQQKDKNKESKLIINEADKLLETMTKLLSSENLFIFLFSNPLVKKHREKVSSATQLQSKGSMISGIPRVESFPFSVDEKLQSMQNLELEYETMKPYISCDYKKLKSEFLKNLNEYFNKYNRSISSHFEMLTLASLKNAIDSSGKVLMISSTECKDDCIYVEGENGEGIGISFEEIAGFFRDSQSCFILIILAIPQSETLATLIMNELEEKRKITISEITYNPCIIYFQFNELFLQQAVMITRARYITIQQEIHDCCLMFFAELAEKNDVDVSYICAVNKFNRDLRKIREVIKDFNMTEVPVDDLGDMKILECTRDDMAAESNIQLFDNQKDDTQLASKVIDLNKTIDKPLFKYCSEHKPKFDVLIGRKAEMFLAIQKINSENDKDENKIFNLYGKSGIGKTHFILQLCDFMSSRPFFSKGIYYFDIADIEDSDELIKKLQESEVFSVIEYDATGNRNRNLNMATSKKLSEDQKVLIVLDNVDKILSLSSSKFYMWISSWISFNTATSIHLIIISKDEVKNEACLPLITMQLYRLNEEESLHLFLYFCRRRIFPNELDVDDRSFTLSLAKMRKDLISKLSYSRRIHLCEGYPPSLKKLASLTASKYLNKISEDDFKPEKKSRGSAMMLSVKSQDEGGRLYRSINDHAKIPNRMDSFNKGFEHQGPFSCTMKEQSNKTMNNTIKIRTNASNIEIHPSVIAFDNMVEEEFLEKDPPFSNNPSEEMNDTNPFVTNIQGPMQDDDSKGNCVSPSKIIEENIDERIIGKSECTRLVYNPVGKVNLAKEKKEITPPLAVNSQVEINENSRSQQKRLDNAFKKVKLEVSGPSKTAGRIVDIGGSTLYNKKVQKTSYGSSLASKSQDNLVNAMQIHSLKSPTLSTTKDGFPRKKYQDDSSNTGKSKINGSTFRQSNANIK